VSDTPTPRTDGVCADLIGDAFMSSHPTHGDWVPVSLSRQLERELAEAKAELEELNAWKKGMRGIEDFYIIREELHKTQSQLTAHKAALEKCQDAILELNEDGGYLTAGSSETCCNCGHVNGHDEGCIQPIVDEALAAIKQLKETK
jgi:hypothetical protein